MVKANDQALPGTGVGLHDRDDVIRHLAARVNSRDWWVFICASRVADRVVSCIERTHYTGKKNADFELLLIPLFQDGLGVVGDPDLAAALAALPESVTGPGWAVESAPDGFAAGELADRVWPVSVVVVAGAERKAMLGIADRLRTRPWAGGAAWLLIDTEDRAGLDALDHGFDVVLFGEPCAGVVAECVRRATEKD